MSSLLPIAINTFKEAVRDKILHGLVFFSLLLILAAVLLGEMSINQEARVLTTLGLSGISLFSVLIAIFIGANLLYKELDRRTIYTIISKPIERHIFLLGKYLGMILTLALQIGLVSLILAILILFRGGDLTLAFVMAILLILLETMIISAVAVLFSSFSSPFLSGLFTLGIFLCSRLSADLVLLAEKSPSQALSLAIKAVAAVLPDLQDFVVVGQVVHQEGISALYILATSGYALAFSGATLALAIVLFNRRDFV